jgi:hypothetical protein
MAKYYIFSIINLKYINIFKPKTIMKNRILTIATILFFANANFAQDLEFTDINAKGKVKLNGQTGTAGQVLTSNGAASPTWNTLTAPLTTAGGQFFIDMQPVSDFNIVLGAPSSQTKIVDLSTLGYNTNGDVSIDLSTDKITFNRTGLYEFEGIMTFNMNSTQVQNASIKFNFVKGATTRFYQFSTIPNTNGTIYSKLINFKFMHRFTVGETLSFTAGFFDLDTNPALVALSAGSLSYVFGRFLSE